MTSARRSRSEAVAAAVARRVRRLPGAEDIAGKTVDRLRSSMLARTVISRVFDLDLTGTATATFLSSGNLLAGHGLENLPVVIVSLVGADPDDTPKMVDILAQEQVLTAGFRPVVLIDSDQFAAVREYGYPVEHLIPRDEWDEEYGDWARYRDHRLENMRRVYSARGIVDLVASPEAGLLLLRTL